jgi:plastocyanin
MFFLISTLISIYHLDLLVVDGQGSDKYIGKGDTNALILLDSTNLGNKSYHPNPILIQMKSNVVWTNNDIVPHSVTAIEGEFDSGIMNAGDVFKHFFDKVNSYDYYCMLHPSMVGKVIVE